MNIKTQRQEKKNQKVTKALYFIYRPSVFVKKAPCEQILTKFCTSEGVFVENFG